MRRSFLLYTATLIAGWCGLAFLSAPVQAASPSAAWLPAHLTLNQSIQSEVAYRVAESPNFTKLLNFYQLEARYDITRGTILTLVGRLSYDPIYDLEPLSEINPFQDRFQSSAPRTISDVDAFDADLREFYGDFFFQKVDLRIGRQIVRWGVIEGFRITDELNPLDFREFILRELTDRYIPLWMVKGDLYFNKATLELIWIPDLSFNRAADAGTEWEQFQTPPGLVEPPQTLRNSEFGLRVSGYVKGADLALSYLDAWDDFPTASRTIFGLSGNIAERSSDFTPRYHRLRTFGFSASKGQGSDVIKAEAAYISGKHFGTLPTDADGDGISDIVELKRAHLKYGLGWDTRLPGDVDTFIQYSQQWILNHNDLIIADAVESGLSILFRREFLYNRLLAKCLILYMFNDKEALIRPRLEYQWSDHVIVAVGADIFEGKQGNVQADDFRFIGFFDQNDRVYTEARYSF